MPEGSTCVCGLKQADIHEVHGTPVYVCGEYVLDEQGDGCLMCGHSEGCHTEAEDAG